MIQLIIDQLGGEGTVHKLVNCFYDIIEKRPEGSHILSLHQDGHGLRHARLEQFNVMCGFLGGRNYYYKKHGHMTSS
jgi:hemoglobin